jgi:hypothetical protein
MGKDKRELFIRNESGLIIIRQYKHGIVIAKSIEDKGVILILPDQVKMLIKWLGGAEIDKGQGIEKGMTEG